MLMELVDLVRGGDNGWIIMSLQVVKILEISNDLLGGSDIWAGRKIEWPRVRKIASASSINGDISARTIC